MSRSQSLEDRLAALDDLRADPASEESRRALHKALSYKTSHVVARAAEIAGEFQIADVEPDLVEAFERFMVNPQKTDPGCAAKTAIAEALYRMEAYQPDIFLEGIGHVQMEPVYGGREDTAAKLRGVCALALVRLNAPNILLLLAQLLADPEADARIAAARAIGYSGLDAGVPLLRYKSLIGDAQPQVLCECFMALLQLDPEPSLSFVAAFLQQDDLALQEAAAVALGESRLVQAFPFLETAWEDADEASLRRALLLGIALLHHDRALTFLLSLVEAGGTDGREAQTALGMYRDDPRVWGRVEAALKARDRVK